MDKIDAKDIDDERPLEQIFKKVKVNSDSLIRFLIKVYKYELILNMDKNIYSYFIYLETVVDGIGISLHTLDKIPDEHFKSLNIDINTKRAIIILLMLHLFKFYFFSNINFEDYNVPDLKQEEKICNPEELKLFIQNILKIKIEDFDLDFNKIYAVYGVMRDRFEKKKITVDEFKLMKEHIIIYINSLFEKDKNKLEEIPNLYAYEYQVLHMHLKEGCIADDYNIEDNELYYKGIPVLPIYDCYNLIIFNIEEEKDFTKFKVELKASGKPHFSDKELQEIWDNFKH